MRVWEGLGVCARARESVYILARVCLCISIFFCTCVCLRVGVIVKEFVGFSDIGATHLINMISVYI